MDLPDIALLLSLLGVVIRVAAVAIVPANRRPSSAMAWLLAIFFIPTLGLIAYVLIGSPKLPGDRRAKQRRINAMILDATRYLDPDRGPRAWPPWLDDIVRLNRNLGAMPMVAGNRAQLLTEYAQSLDAMSEAVRQSRSHVHAEFYILSHDAATAPFFDELQAAVARGVQVRVLFDHVGSMRSPGYRSTLKRLDETGAVWRRLLPVKLLPGGYRRPDLRNHRKLLVVDGRVAFTGSQNLVDRSYGRRANRRRGLQWHDLMLRLEGPIVRGIDALFITDWYGETDELLAAEIDPAPGETRPGAVHAQVVPSGPSFEAENNLRLFNSLLYEAQRRVSISSPYFVPDESLFYAVTTAAQRGVEVELFVSEIGDQFLTHHAQRSYYEQLLRAGIRIHLYPPPYILHAKHLSIDEEVAVVGSSNMDMRSFSLNLEISLLVADRDFVSRLRAVEDVYRRQSRELTLEEWLGRPFHQRAIDNAARLTSAVQ